MPWIEWLADVVLEKLESRFAFEMFQIPQRTSAEIIDTENRMPVRE